MLLLRRVVGRVAACGGAGGGGAARPCYALPQRLLAAVGSRAPFSALALGCARALPAQPQPVRARLSSSGGAAAPPEVGLLGLNNLAPNPGAHKPARRVGRGRGGGRGKTSGRGHKGAGARKGKKIPYVGFEGGQSPLYRRIPKRGFKNTRFKREYAELNLDTLAHFIRSSRLQQPLEREIGLKELSDSGAVSISMHHVGVKLLGTGTEGFDLPIRLAVSAASASAIEAIERAGGSIRTVYHDRLGLRAVLSPHKFEVLPRQAYPPPRLMARYMDEAKRGYLSHLRGASAELSADRGPAQESEPAPQAA